MSFTEFKATSNDIINWGKKKLNEKKETNDLKKKRLIISLERNARMLPSHSASVSTKNPLEIKKKGYLKQVFK